MSCTTGMAVLGQGAILAGLVLGAIVAFIIDKRFVSAAIFAVAGAVLSFVGLIHAEKVDLTKIGTTSGKLWPRLPAEAPTSGKLCLDFVSGSVSVWRYKG